MTNKAQIATWVHDYGEDSDFVRVRVKGESPRAGTMQFIDSECVQHAVERELIKDLTAAWSWAWTSRDRARRDGDPAPARPRRPLDWRAPDNDPSWPRDSAVAGEHADSRERLLSLCV